MVNHFLLLQGMMGRQLTFLVIALTLSAIVSMALCLFSLILLKRGVATQNIIVSLMFHIQFASKALVRKEVISYGKDNEGHPVAFFTICRHRMLVAIEGLDEQTVDQIMGQSNGNPMMMYFLSWPIITRKGLVLPAEDIQFQKVMYK